MLPQHLTGTMNEQLFLFLLEEETVAASCSRDRCKQQRFGTEEMSPCGQISCLPSQRMCLKKGPMFQYDLWCSIHHPSRRAYVCQYDPDSNRELWSCIPKSHLVQTASGSKMACTTVSSIN